MYEMMTDKEADHFAEEIGDTPQSANLAYTVRELRAERDSESRWAKRYHDALVAIVNYYDSVEEEMDMHSFTMADLARVALQGLATDALPEEKESSTSV